MNLSFDFTPVQTAVIYSDDDPEYIAGSKKPGYELTERQEQVKKMFLRVIAVVKRKDLPVNMDKLLDASRDYVQERSDIDEFGWVGESISGHSGA